MIETTNNSVLQSLVDHLKAELSAYKIRAHKAEERSKRESESLTKLFEALAKAQAQMEAGKKDCANTYFNSKYADLSSIVEASRAALTNNGLSVIQRICVSDTGAQVLLSRLCHNSGQWIESEVVLDPSKKDVQAMGSYITYMRRYAYASLVGVVTTDDDGEGAMKETRNPTKAAVETISRPQLVSLSEELQSRPGDLDYILNTASITKLSDLPASRYSGVMKWVQSTKGKESK